MTYIGPDGNNYTNLCHYHAKCNDGYATYTCTCSPAWKGAMCDTDVDECADAAALSPPESLCENFGTCINTRGAYECKCIKGAFGFNCSENPDDCALSNEFVDEKYWPNRCISRDHYFREPNCTDGFDEYTCNCSIYWTGEFCMTDVDECKVNDPYPCENNGTCINTPGFYQCDCINGTEGFNCSINPNDCENITQCGLSDPLGNCTDGFAEWWCTCGPDYTGEFCDLEMPIYRVLQLIGGKTANEKDLIKMMKDLLTNPSMMKDLVPFVIGLQSEENRTKMSWSAEDLFEWIAYEEKSLNPETDLVMWNDVVLGNCFTFNHFNSTRQYRMRQAGAQGGLKAAIKLNSHEYLNYTETTAIMTFIHPNTETIFSESPRYNAEPGAHTTIQTTESRFVRLGGRYGWCVNHVNEVNSYYYDGSYTTDGCLRSCYQDEVFKACTCMDSRYPKDTNARACELPDRDCVDSITSKGDVSRWAHCECPLPCANSQFDSSFSMAPFVRGSAKCNSLKREDRVNNTACNTKGEQPDYLILSVQVPNLAVKIYVETASWDFNKIIGNIGGLGGVVCGLNMVSITGRLGCINTTGQWIPMPEAEVFLFEDDEFADPHDLLAKTVTDKDGRFAIAGEEKERWDYPRFFLGFYAYCNGKKYGNWTGGPCADQEFIDECDTYARYRTTHSFEKGGDGSEKPGASQLYRDRYRLDCTLGFAGGGTMPGLSCGGSMCWHGGSWRPKPKVNNMI
ncbi:hypothetical protein PRIPAC_83529 [Pristionchus pacificus]|uniref:Ion channel n=1 Tax=Pristionchus pacificus TaxID=54126 RepID=A0A2A6BSL6_PRIPA|nr:hypothetical protein PRIPAC_83529 [Pristionchus pacificus]|eukprot:PDM68816.1 ion channel [Pristionchus pacificus]